MRTSRHLLQRVRRALLIAFGSSGCINILMLATPIFTLRLLETVVPTGGVETLILLAVMLMSAIIAAVLLDLSEIIAAASRRFRHHPGQWAEILVLTGERTVIDQLSDPIVRNFNRALRACRPL